jgi:hypothetical protein
LSPTSLFDLSLRLPRNDSLMTSPRRKREIFANPFFAVLLFASVVFVLTVLAYLVSGRELAGALGSDGSVPPQGDRSLALARWFDRNAPFVLAGEFVVMFCAAVLAMLLDPWFSARSRPKPPK